MIFIAFGIKCAFPLLHNWLQDAYPAATVTGTVVLSAFTTKLAVYSLARGFPGTEILIYIGAIMTLFPIFLCGDRERSATGAGLFAEQPAWVHGRRRRHWHGTGAEWHGGPCLCPYPVQGALFMSVGAVLFRTGTAKGPSLAGFTRPCR